MDSTFTSIERRRSTAMWTVVVLLVLSAAPSGMAHDLPGHETDREIVRLQGYRAEAPDGVEAVRAVVLSILGEQQTFYLTDFRRFRLTDEKAPQTDKDRGPFAIQGERGALVKIANARPGQRVTILGERRATSPDIFLLALDFCPPE